MNDLGIEILILKHDRTVLFLELQEHDLSDYVYPYFLSEKLKCTSLHSVNLVHSEHSVHLVQAYDLHIFD